eukprot:4070631-Pleurochrysis_carterae.AAC.1
MGAVHYGKQLPGTPWSSKSPRYGEIWGDRGGIHPPKSREMNTYSCSALRGTFPMIENHMRNIN